MSLPAATKRCTSCKQSLPLTDFGRNRATRDGHATECRLCRQSQCAGFVSLYATVKSAEGLQVIDMLPAPIHEPDATYDEVVKVLWMNVDAGVITESQMAAILLHAVEGWSFSEIARMAGMERTTVGYHYERGIKRMRERYAAS